MSWSADQLDDNGNVIVVQNVDLSSLPNNELEYDGRIATLALVNAYGENAEGVAGVYCYNYAPIGFEHSKNSWYLASGAEYQNLVKNNRDKINVGISRLEREELPWSHTWVSVEANAYQARYYHAGNIYTHEKSVLKVVRCVLAI